MKTTGLLRVLFFMSLSVSVAAHAVDLQKEIAAEATLGMKATAAKSSRESLVHLVPLGGMTFARLKGAANQGYTFTAGTGYEGGIGVLIGRGNLQFETGLMYSSRSAVEEYRMGVSTWDLTYQNKYLELPLMVRYNVINNNDIRVYAKGGGVASLLQDSRGSMSNMQNYNASIAQAQSGIYSPYNAYSPYGMYGATTTTSLASDDNTKNAFNPMDFRWALGLGGQVRINKSIAILLEGDYQTSVNTVSNSQPNGYAGSTAMNLTLETYGIRAGMLISL